MATETEKNIQALIDLDLDLNYDRVLVVPDETVQKSPGGIILPDTAQEKPRKGTVVAYGPDCIGTNDAEKNPRANKIQRGSKVVYGKYAGAELKINGVETVILREHDIFFAYPSNSKLEVELI